MKSRLIIFFLLVLTAIIYRQFTLVSPHPWFVLYSGSVSPWMIKGVDLAILDPDLVDDETLKQCLNQCVAYLSLGEAHESRHYWSDIKDSKIIIQPNEQWNGAYRVDIRDPVWRNIILHDSIPSIIKKGYTGVFLDTVDVAAFLESQDPVRFQGMKFAAIDIIFEIHRLYPQLKLYMNNGFGVLNKVAEVLSGVVVEDLYTRYLFEEDRVVKTPIDESLLKEKAMLSMRKKYGVMLFTVLYTAKSEDQDSTIISWAKKVSEENSINWYVGPIDLDHIGEIND